MGTPVRRCCGHVEVVVTTGRDKRFEEARACVACYPRYAQDPEHAKRLRGDDEEEEMTYTIQVLRKGEWKIVGKSNMKLIPAIVAWRDAVDTEQRLRNNSVEHNRLRMVRSDGSVFETLN